MHQSWISIIFPYQFALLCGLCGSSGIYVLIFSKIKLELLLILTFFEVASCLLGFNLLLSISCQIIYHFFTGLLSLLLLNTFATFEGEVPASC